MAETNGTNAPVLPLRLDQPRPERIDSVARPSSSDVPERLEFYGGDWAALGEEIENRSWNGGKLLP